MSTLEEIQQVERQLGELQKKLVALRRDYRGAAVPDYTFTTLGGQVTLRDLFAGRDKLLLIHNMGQGCRYCTLWADGFNGLVPHLESVVSLALVSKDPPELQRCFASGRGWRFRLASHGGGTYLREQSVSAGADNMPGAVLYEREGDRVYRKNSCVFGPGDIYCAMWSLLGLAGLGEQDWTPQFSYWQRPRQLEDGGENLIE
ncbi:DUF899 family protein [Microbulbifer sp. 2201CG32-9]|uniref:DUF899 family protein n=1 Tax=Microbulbifer sp. 2201CG32-9 TaxID=3232309 RepID=UPI00345C0643